MTSRKGITNVYDYFFYYYSIEAAMGNMAYQLYKI